MFEEAMIRMVRRLHLLLVLVALLVGVCGIVLLLKSTSVGTPSALPNLVKVENLGQADNPEGNESAVEEFTRASTTLPSTDKRDESVEVTARLLSHNRHTLNGTLRLEVRRDGVSVWRSPIFETDGETRVSVPARPGDTILAQGYVTGFLSDEQVAVVEFDTTTITMELVHVLLGEETRVGRFFLGQAQLAPPVLLRRLLPREAAVGLNTGGYGLWFVPSGILDSITVRRARINFDSSSFSFAASSAAVGLLLLEYSGVILRKYIVTPDQGTSLDIDVSGLDQFIEGSIRVRIHSSSPAPISARVVAYTWSHLSLAKRSVRSEEFVDEIVIDELAAGEYEIAVSGGMHGAVTQLVTVAGCAEMNVNIDFSTTYVVNARLIVADQSNGVPIDTASFRYYNENGHELLIEKKQAGSRTMQLLGVPTGRGYLVVDGHVVPTVVPIQLEYEIVESGERSVQLEFRTRPGRQELQVSARLWLNDVIPVVTDSRLIVPIDANGVGHSSLRVPIGIYRSEFQASDGTSAVGHLDLTTDSAALVDLSGN